MTMQVSGPARGLVRMIGVLAALCATLAAHAQDNSLEQLRQALTGRWYVGVDGNNEARGMRIAGVEQKGEGAFALDVAFGFFGREQSVSSSEFVVSGAERRLTLTARSGAKVSAIQKPDGAFEGTFTAGSDPVRSVRLVKLSANGTWPEPTVESAASDVPPACAAFLGGWTGTWNKSGTAYLWVKSVDANCMAMAAYGRNPRPHYFVKAAIKDGVLVYPNEIGTNHFRFNDGQLVDRFIGNGIDDSIAFRKVGSTESARVPTPVPPAADVPAACAALFGNWSGTWTQGGVGRQWLRIIGVDAACVATYAYVGFERIPAAYDKATITDGRLSFVCNRSTGGTCVFERRGDTLSANYSNPGGGSNSASFARLP